MRSGVDTWRAQYCRRITLAISLCAAAACDRSVWVGTHTNQDGAPPADRQASGGAEQTETGGETGSGAGGGSGGSGGTGGLLGSGGGGGSGGMSPSGGAGGAVASCQVNATQCSTDGLQTCGANGQWGMPVPCGLNQTCGGAAGSAACSCASACTVGATQCTSSTTLGTCTAGPNGCNVQSTAACDSGLVCERLAPASCADPQWAQWPLPPTISPTDYTDHGDGTVTDNITGLMWEKEGSTTPMTQPYAVTFCATMVATGGHRDWRLPSKIELVSLWDWRQANPIINPIFPVSPYAYWSSTPFIGGSLNSAWVVKFVDTSYPNPHHYSMTSQCSVRCVR